MKTAIFILSYRRAERLRTTVGSLNFIPKAWKDRTYIVCREEEKEAYTHTAEHFGVRCVSIPSSVTSVDPLFDWSETMDYILTELAIGDNYDNVIIMDDDLKFARLKESGENPEKASEDDMLVMLDKLINRSFDIPLAGIATRGFVVSKGVMHTMNKSVAAVFSLHVPFFREHPEFRFFNEKTRFMGDRYMCIRLLQAGHQNEVFSEFTYDSITNQQGGCSVRRTNALHNASALNIIKMFPSLISMKVKTNLGDTRLDLKIHWSKVYRPKETT